MIKIRAICVGIVSFISIANASAIDLYYADKARGWFWHEDPPEEIILPKVKPEIVKSVEPPKPPEAQKPASPPAPENFSVEWFKENFKKLQSRAIDDPSVENVTAMLAAERIMRDKATKVSTVAQDVIKTTPWLDENARTPSTTFGENAGKSIAEEGVKRWAKAVASQTAIWFFFKSDCPYCKAQIPVLQFLSRAYGFKVMAISMDGGTIPGMDPAWGIRMDAGQSQRLGVSVTPTLFLAKPPGDLVPLAYGLTPALEIASRSVDVAVAQGWINQKAKSDIRITKPDPDVSRELSDKPKVTYQDSKQIIEYVKNVLRSR